MAEVSGFQSEIAHSRAGRGHLLVRQLEKIVQQPKLIHHLQRGRMHSVAPKIAKEVGVLLKDRYVHTRPRQQIPQHDAGRSAADHATGSSE